MNSTDRVQTNPTTAPAASPDSPSRRKIALAAAALIAATLAAYHGIFSTPFVFDDQASIVNNATIRNLARISDVLSPPHAAGETVGGRPVLNLTFALNYAVSGTAVWSYHALNLAIHLGAGLLLFGLARRALVSPTLREKFGDAATPLAFAIAALWLLHPLQTESVTYTAQRAESLAAFFVLLTLYAFARGAESPAPLRWFALSLGACTLGMGTKETVVVAPLLVVLYDGTFLAGSFRVARERRRGVYFALAATWILLVALVVRTGGDRGGTAGLGGAVSSWTYALTQCRALVHYLRLAVCPGPLVFDYGIGTAGGLSEVLPQAVIVLILLAATAVTLARWPALGFVGAWFFVVLAPSSSFVPVASQPLAEHRMYLPLAAAIVVAASGARAWLGRWWLWCLLALAAVLGGLTARRNQVYASELALWSDTAAHAPGNARAHNNLANALLAAGRTSDALAAYETALRLAPDYLDAHANYARALAQAGRTAEAIPHYETALRTRPDSVDTHFNLGNAFLRTGDFSGARAHYEQVLKLRPERVDAHVNLAAALLRLGRIEEAIAHYNNALQLAPDDAGAHIDLANALVQQRRLAEALAHYEHALRLRPDLSAVREQIERLRAAAPALKN